MVQTQLISLVREKWLWLQPLSRENSFQPPVTTSSFFRSRPITHDHRWGSGWDLTGGLRTLPFGSALYSSWWCVTAIAILLLLWWKKEEMLVPSIWSIPCHCFETWICVTQWIKALLWIVLLFVFIYCFEKHDSSNIKVFCVKFILLFYVLP